jgi:NADH-quinone oxidoreductase subunit E
MNETANMTCRRNSWLAALVIGLIVAAMLLVVGHQGFFRALVIGAVIGVLLGFFLVWAFCKGETVAAMTAEPSRPIPAPTPAPEPVKAAAIPEAALVPAQSERASAETVTTSTAPVAAAPKPATERRAAAKPKAAARPKAAKAEAAAPKSAARTSAPKAATPKARTGSALDAALAKSKEPVSTAGPELLTAPRGGKADDLKQIKGVGPKLEKLLNDVGVWHFDQIASWKARDIAVVDGRMEGFKGRISRDEWVKQAKVLAKGGTTEFSTRVAKGDVY